MVATGWCGPEHMAERESSFFQRVHFSGERERDPRKDSREGRIQGEGECVLGI